MGTSFTTTHINNAQNLTKAQFKKAFTDMMKAKGYTVSDEENTALTYTLVFAPDRKWVTILTDGSDTRREAAELAKGLKSYAVMIDLVDSDFAELSLFDEAGAHKDTLTLGDSYLEEAAPMGEPAAWQPLLCGSWEQVQEIQNGSYTFAEDALAQFAPLIGMDSGDILLDNDSVADDKNAVVLYFKKAAEKKLTFKTAFTKIFGNGLKSLGFSTLKAKDRIFFVRLFHGDILQIITYRKVTSSKRDHFAFEIYGGMVSLYRKKIDFEISPETWLRNLVVFYTFSTPLTNYDADLAYDLMTFHFDNKNSKNAQKCVTLAFDMTIKYIINAFNNMNSLKDCIEYFYDYQLDMTLAEYDDFISNPLYCISEGLLLVLADYKGDCKKWVERKIEHRIDSMGNGANTENIRKVCEEEHSKKLELRNKIQDTPQIRKLFLDMAETNKLKNIRELKMHYNIELDF